MKTIRQKKKYISVKLPMCGNAYPLDSDGCHKLPNYTQDYLKKRGDMLFDILLNQVPSTVYSQLLKRVREIEHI